MKIWLGLLGMSGQATQMNANWIAPGMQFATENAAVKHEKASFSGNRYEHQKVICATCKSVPITHTA